MKVILAVEPIRPPLTGIGRYTWELATRLPKRLGEDALTYIANGQWVDLPSLNHRPTSPRNKNFNLIKKLKLLPRLMIQLPLANQTYQFLWQRLNLSRLNRTDYDLYHGPNYFVPKTKKPSVVTIHDLSTVFYPNWHPEARVQRINKLLPKAVNHANIVITDSKAIREEVISEYNLPAEKVISIPLGVDPIFKPRSDEVLSPILTTYGLIPHGYSLCVATIEPRKNIDRLLDAYRSLPPALRHRWPLVIIGEAGWNSSNLHQKIKKAISEGWLRYLGFVPLEHLPLLYAGAGLFIYPSLYEGFGLPIVEAFASGVPVITSNCSSMPEVAQDSAYLINPNSTESLHHAITICLEDETKRNNMIKAGLQRAKELNWDTCVDLTVEAYKLALK